jgi:membrane protease YdiL (CAAX protease family)
MTETLSLLTMFVPLFFIVWLANVAEARRRRQEPYEGLALVVYVFMVVLYGVGVLIGVLLQFGAMVAALDPTIFEELGQDAPFASLPLLALGLWLPSLFGIILLLPAVRRRFARFTPLDPESPVHAIALSLSMLVLINLIMTLGIGLGNLADILATTEATESNTLITLWMQQILTALLALVGVGWLTRRNWGETVARLALTLPSGREWLIGLGTGLGMVPVVLLIEALASAMGLTPDADVERLTEQLLGSLFTTPLGILTIGLSAGLGEETLFRGALLPRFGLLLTSILFALVHSNYGITLSTLVVLLLGLLLGWLRLRYSTSTAMITHAVYNMTLGLLAFLSASALDV